MRERVIDNQATALRNLYDECVRFINMDYGEGPKELTLSNIRMNLSHVYFKSAWDDETMEQFVTSWELLKARNPQMPPMKHENVNVIIEKIKVLAFGFNIDSSINDEDLETFDIFKKKVRFDTLSAEKEREIRQLLARTSGGARRAARKRPAKRQAH